MATATIYVKLQTVDTQRGELIPVPNARLICRHERFLWDADLSSGNDITDANGFTSVDITYNEEDVDNLNPYFAITIPEANRAVPDLTPAHEQFTLPGSWETRHYVQRRLPGIINYTNIDDPLKIYIGLHGRLQLSYTDFDASNIRNAIAIPQHTLRFYLADYDTFIFDWLNPDDTIIGVGFDHSATDVEDRYIQIGPNDRYPYYNTWPTVPSNLPTAATTPHACIDPPESPVGRLGQGGFQVTGPLATDLHGFIFMIDGNVIRRFYPNGYLCESINYGFDSPGGLAVDQYQNLYVADTGNDRIVGFRLNNADSQSGTYMFTRRIGSRGNGNLQFDNPTDLTVVPGHEVDQNEWLAIADTGNHRVQIIRLNITGSGNRSIRCSAFPGFAMPYLSQFGTPGVGSGASAGNAVVQTLWEPVAICSDRNRCLYVADKSWHRISKWCVNAAGTGYDHQADWEKVGGGSGNGNREFDTPVNLALDPKNRYLYVGEEGNNRIQRINAEDGSHLYHWQPNMGAAALIPVGLAADNRGEVFVSDSASGKILRGTVYTADGNAKGDGDAPDQVAYLWQSRLSEGHMYAPAYVAHNRLDNSLWVADSGNNRIKVYRLDPAFTLNPATAPSADGFNNPVGITFDTLDTIFIADSGNNRIRSYSSDLNHQQDTGNTWSNGPGTLASDSADNFYVVERSSHLLQKLNSNGELIISWGRFGKGRGEFDEPHFVAVDSSDNIYVTDGGNHRVQKFDNNGVYLTEWGGQGSRDGEFDSPRGIAVDSSDNIFVVDNANHRVQKFDAAGVFISSFGSLGNADAEFRSPIGITIDSTNHIYVGDNILNEVKKFDAAGSFARKWGGSGNGDGQFDNPQGMSIDNSDHIYVADNNNNRVQKFNASGAFQLKWGTHGSADGEFDAPAGLVVNNASDKVFVADKDNNRIQEFDLNGVFVSKWGEGGTGDNEFNTPRGIEYVTRASGAALYVAEQGNNRIKRMNASGPIHHLTEAAGGSPLRSPEDVCADSNGHLYVADTGNNRIIKYDSDDNHLRDITPTDASLAFSAPSGVSIVEKKVNETKVIELLVTDRGNNRVLLIDQTGTVVAYWDFMNFVRQQVAGVTSTGAPIASRIYDTELSSLITLDNPSNSVMDQYGSMMVSDTAHDQVRLLRIYTDFHANLFDLGEELPDISIRCHADGNWQDELGLHATAGYDNSVNRIETSPTDDYSKDTYTNQHLFNQTQKMNSSTNILRVVRQTQSWLRHITRHDEAGHKWEEKELELFFNISSQRGSYHPWGADNINMGQDPSGKGNDAWDDSTVVHEMGHWIFDNSCHPEIPYTRVGGTHQRRDIISPNLAFTEAYAEFHQMFWSSGSEFGSISPVRGFGLSGSFSTLTNIRAVQYDANDVAIPASIVPQYLYGGPPAAAAPTFNDPEKGMQNEGYLANTLWQMHHALIEPEILFADNTGFWYRYNNHISIDKSELFCHIFRRALRDFPESPTSEQLNQASRQYLLQVLTRAHGINAATAQIIQSIFELNNQLMPVVTVSEQQGDGSAGPVIDQIAVTSGSAKTLLIQVKDATSGPLPGYSIKITVQTGTPGHYALEAAPNPTTLHGRHAPAAPPVNELYRTTDNDGEVTLTCTVPAGTLAATETLLISYQPHFDTDATFSAPLKNDTLATTYQKLYLYELRWAGKTWPGTGNNFGAIVDKTFTVNIS
ncbi:MAG: hypothetical protein GY799_07470 [Desulfobulbaceae bacterium]|nr:hypothetical protein [Desulfobulbaceae bacterium]